MRLSVPGGGLTRRWKWLAKPPSSHPTRSPLPPSCSRLHLCTTLQPPHPHRPSHSLARPRPHPQRMMCLPQVRPTRTQSFSTQARHQPPASPTAYLPLTSFPLTQPSRLIRPCHYSIARTNERTLPHSLRDLRQLQGAQILSTRPRTTSVTRRKSRCISS